MIDTYLSEERVVIMMSLSNAADGFCSTIAWNCADKELFGDCPLDTGDEVQVVSSFFGNGHRPGTRTMPCNYQGYGRADQDVPAGRTVRDKIYNCS